jgi:hypothetical protein
VSTEHVFEVYLKRLFLKNITKGQSQLNKMASVEVNITLGPKHILLHHRRNLNPLVITIKLLSHLECDAV